MSEQINQNNPKLDEIAQADYNTTRMPGETDEQLIQRLHNIIDQRAQTPKQPDEYQPEYIDKGALFDTVWDFFEGKKSVSKKAILELIGNAPAVPVVQEAEIKAEAYRELAEVLPILVDIFNILVPILSKVGKEFDDLVNEKGGAENG